MNPESPVVNPNTPTETISETPQENQLNNPAQQQTNWPLSFLFLIIGILIGVGGLWGYQKYYSESTNKPISHLTPTPPTTPIGGNTKLQVNNNNGLISVKDLLSFNLPSGWNYKVCNGGTGWSGVIVLGDEKHTSICAPESGAGIIELTFWDNPPVVSNALMGIQISTKNNILIDGISALKQTEKVIDGPRNGNQYTAVYFNNGNIHFTYTLNIKDNIKDFDQILSTFKFTEAMNPASPTATPKAIVSPTPIY